MVITMSHQCPYHARNEVRAKAWGKAVPILGAAGLSLTLASGASAATRAPAPDVLTHDAGSESQITLSEECSDISLATFYVFDKENTRSIPAGRITARHGRRGRLYQLCQLRWLWLLDGHLLHVPGVRERCLSAACVRTSRRTGTFIKSQQPT